MSNTSSTLPPVPQSAKRYARYLLTMAGLGGLLYGVDVGIIAAALPYIEETTSYTQAQLSSLVMAVLLGSVISSLFAGMLSDAFGRKPIMLLASLLFALSIPVICLSDMAGDSSFGMLMFGRILQGASAGLIGVVVPLYLAECLGADSRGKGTGMFQFLLTVGLVFAALIGFFTAKHVESKKVEFAENPIVQVVEQSATTSIVESESAPAIPSAPAPLAEEDEEVKDDVRLTEVKESAWKIIFWVSILPGVILFLGGFRLSESPRWLFSRGRKEEALASLSRNNGAERAQLIYDEMSKLAEEEAQAKEAAKSAGSVVRDSLFQKKYIIPFVLAVVILACNQATGINSVLNYSVKIFQQAGLQGENANIADLAIKITNCIMTVVAVALVDKRGRKFLLKLGTSGIIVGLCGVGALFLWIEQGRVDVKPQLEQFVNNEALKVNLSDPVILKQLGLEEGADVSKKQIILSYNQSNEGAKLAVQDFASNSKDGKPTYLRVKAEKFPSELGWFDKAYNTVAFWKSADDKQAELDRLDTLKVLAIEKAELADKPSQLMGWGVTGFFVFFIAFYAAGPGVCVWLALSELMPTRIRSNGMAIALLINQGVSTTIAGIFLPWVNNWGYSGVFFTLGGFTVIYFITAAIFLPETKGRTLEEIEEYFTTGKMPADKGEGEQA